MPWLCVLIGVIAALITGCFDIEEKRISTVNELILHCTLIGILTTFATYGFFIGIRV